MSTPTARASRARGAPYRSGPSGPSGATDRGGGWRTRGAGWRTRRVGPPLLCVIVYLALAAVVYGWHSPVTTTTLPPCGCGDISSQTWFVAWPAYALSSGHNPFYSTFVAYPGGINLMTNTAAPLLGVLFAPVTLLLGPVASFGLIMRLGFALSAIAMCFVLRRWTTWWPAAFVGGLLYAFSPFMMGQGQSHDFLIFVPLPPLMLALLDEWIVRRRHPGRNGVLLGVVVTAQLLISPEVLEMAGLLSLFGLAVLALRHPVGAAERLGDIGRGLAAGAIAVAVLAGYPLWMYFDGPYHVSGAPHPVSLLAARYYGSVLSLVYPTAFQRFTLGHWLARGTSLSHGGDSEYTTYLGIPLLVLLGLIVVRFRRVGVVQLLTLVAVAAWTVTLGEVLHVGLNPHDSIRLPYALLRRVPLVDGALDLRYSLIMYLAVSVVVAVGLDRFRAGDARPAAGTRSRPRRSRHGILGLVIVAVALLPLVPAIPFASSPVHTPAAFTSEQSPIADGDVVLSFPLPVGYIGFDDQALLWQAEADMRFKLIGFRGAVPGPDHRAIRNAALLLAPLPAEQLLSWALYGAPAPPPPADAATYAAIRTFLGRYRVGAVSVVPPGAHWPAVLRYFTAALDTAPVDFHGTYVWAHVQSDLQRTGVGHG
jgi:hypothetical protein